ncbi:glycoside hydrolase family 97 N-terminal domain-containing protein [Gramella sp. AN32]|uniref:Glycoside hydrolase family 97 N-terminal domain-containing protein n=1 Tax=Christiangramia antarctica TaxID=2058158 RepID=A0ABW5X0S0_9FLAO|nr:glycoside hydrolase family 97 N-terminal domain-containing protein [Gramella sp. AN32]MCM4155739.1 hypothetical protein [Gramella sp. AN32]
MKKVLEDLLKCGRVKIHSFSMVIAILLAIPVLAQEEVELISPDGHLIFNFRMTDSLPVYDINYKEKQLVNPSSLSLSFQKTGDFGRNVEVKICSFLPLSITNWKSGKKP